VKTVYLCFKLQRGQYVAQIDKQFGDILRKIREARNMTQEAFAKFCGISRAYYGRIERGEHSITLEQCQKIAEATGLSMAELFKDIV